MAEAADLGTPNAKACAWLHGDLSCWRGAVDPGGHWMDGALSLAGSSQLVSVTPAALSTVQGTSHRWPFSHSGLWGGNSGPGWRDGLEEGLLRSCAIQPVTERGHFRESPALSRPAVNPSCAH